jgi:hypothetical protein
VNADVQILRCNGGHSWTRPVTNGRPPVFCPDHAPTRPAPSSSNSADAQRLRRHDGSEVVSSDVIQWARSLGFDIHPKLKGKVAGILVDRYNREHPDRPYTRVTR